MHCGRPLAIPGVCVCVGNCVLHTPGVYIPVNANLCGFELIVELCGSLVSIGWVFCVLMGEN